MVAYIHYCISDVYNYFENVWPIVVLNINLFFDKTVRINAHINRAHTYIQYTYLFSCAFQGEVSKKKRFMEEFGSSGDGKPPNYKPSVYDVSFIAY